MPEVSAKDVQELRRATGAGILDARRALLENGNDQEKAVRWLREQGLAGASKREGRERAEGAVSTVLAESGHLGAIVALECETDFVAKSQEFVALVDALANDLLNKGEASLEERQAEIDALKVTLKENIALGRHVRFEAGENSVLGSYLHVQNGRGVNGVLVEISNATPDLAHDLAVHIAFARPEFLSRSDVPEDAVAAEKATIEKIARNEGKPDAVLAKIIDGRLDGWYKERVLLDQAYAKDEKQTIAALLKGATVERFAQVVVGS